MMGNKGLGVKTTWTSRRISGKEKEGRKEGRWCRIGGRNEKGARKRSRE